jgi:hypothetical protein
VTTLDQVHIELQDQSLDKNLIYLKYWLKINLKRNIMTHCTSQHRREGQMCFASNIALTLSQNIVIHVKLHNHEILKSRIRQL